MLCSQRLVEGDAHAIFDAQALFLGLSRGLLPFFGSYLAVEIKFAAEYHVLLDENTVLSSTIGPASNFFTDVADRWIGPKSRLQSTARGRVYSCFGLSECRIIRKRHPLEFFQSHSLGTVCCTVRGLLRLLIL